VPLDAPDQALEHLAHLAGPEVPGTAPTSGLGGLSATPMNTGRTYVVVSGDSLSKIAKRQYGDAQKWPKIYEANRSIIKNPDLIYPGQELRIPEA